MKLGRRGGGGGRGEIGKLSGVAMGLVKSQWGSLSVGLLQGVGFFSRWLIMKFTC